MPQSGARRLPNVSVYLTLSIRFQSLYRMHLHGNDKKHYTNTLPAQPAMFLSSLDKIRHRAYLLYAIGMDGLHRQYFGRISRGNWPNCEVVLEMPVAENNQSSP